MWIRWKTVVALHQSIDTGVDKVREGRRRGRAEERPQGVYVDYLASIQEGTDKLQNRKRRAEILRDLLAPVFSRKDDQRRFSPEIRRILWNTAKRKRCSVCNQALDASSFHIDHIKAHSRGGRTVLRNAALICPACNIRKGARRHSRRRHGRAA
jgi:5-methylcytosine-specific restriction endonuclease McrA